MNERFDGGKVAFKQIVILRIYIRRITFSAAKAAQEAQMSVRSFVRSSVCPFVRILSL